MDRHQETVEAPGALPPPDALASACERALAAVGGTLSVVSVRHRVGIDVTYTFRQEDDQ